MSKNIAESLGLTRDEWFALARGFYSLAHSNPADFEALPAKLKSHPVGALCREYISTNNTDLLEKAGYLLTGTRQWYVYIGRTM